MFAFKVKNRQIGCRYSPRDASVLVPREEHELVHRTGPQERRLAVPLRRKQGERTRHLTAHLTTQFTRNSVKAHLYGPFWAPVQRCRMGFVTGSGALLRMP